MKKSSLLVTLPALAFAGLLLSGCGMFRSTKAWETAKQEAPLEIPPGMDTPPANAALVIPPPGSGQPQAAPAPGQVSDAFVVSDTVDNTYQKVGQLLAGGSVGQLTGHDDSAHAYTVNVVGGEMVARKRGFFGRMFHHDKNKATADTATHSLQVTVNPSGSAASEVRVRGDEGAVAKLTDALRKGMGG